MTVQDSAILEAVERASGHMNPWVTSKQVARHIPDVSVRIVGRKLGELARAGALTTGGRQRGEAARYRIPTQRKEGLSDGR